MTDRTCPRGAPMPERAHRNAIFCRLRCPARGTKQRSQHTISVTAETYERIMAAAKQRGWSAARLVDAACLPAIGHNWNRGHVSISAPLYRELARVSVDQGRPMSAIVEEVVHAAIDQAEAAQASAVGGAA